LPISVAVAVHRARGHSHGRHKFPPTTARAAGALLLAADRRHPRLRARPRRLPANAAVIGGLSFLVQCLGRYPEIRARAREEMQRQAPSGPLDTAAIRKLDYLDRVCKESRRVAPVLPITF